MHAQVEDLDQDYTMAARHYPHSVQYGNSEAMVELCLMYFHDDNVKKSLNFARDLLQAAKGHADDSVYPELGYIYCEDRAQASNAHATD